MPPTLRKRKAPEPAPAAAAAPPPKKAAAAPKKTAAAPKKAAAPNKPAVAPAPKKKEAAAAAAAAPKKETTTAAAAAAAAPKKEAVEAEAEAETEAKDAPAPAPAPATAKAASKQVAVGDTVQLDDFGGEIETNDGVKTTLKKLVDESKSGVVLFTYPKASTPGCTKQVCFFRDAYKPLTADSGLAIYGLSADSPKANTAFRKNQKLPYPLLCDPDATLIAAIGLRKNPRGTQRGVFVVDKHGKVLVAEAGSPQGTFDRVKALVEELKG